MSFSSNIKEYLSRITSDGKCCQKAELSGIVRTCGVISLLGKNKLSVSIRTELPSVARLVFTLFKKVYSLQTRVNAIKNTSLHKTTVYEIHIEDALEYLLDLQIIDDKQGFYAISNEMPESIIRKECDIKAYIRGFFLGCGSVSNPEKTYHLEFTMHNVHLAERFAMLLNQFDLNAKSLERKNNVIVYIKESEKIVDFLNVIGAHKSRLDYENVRVIKQMRNNVNRIVNCETANLNKVIDAALVTIGNIEKISQKIGLESLPENLKEVAEIRLENPEMSLKEIGEQMNPPLSKSGVNHRLKKINEIADSL